MTGSTRPKNFMLKTLLLASLLGALVMFSACASVGPDYEKPETKMPVEWKKPPDPALVRGEADIRKWWEVFADPQLTGLIKRSTKGNLDLKAAMARVKEARARVGIAAGRAYPEVNVPASAIRQGGSENDISQVAGTYNRFSAGLDASWEIDLFGRIRRSVEAAKADYQASEEDRVDVLVTLYSEVALTYLYVRTLQARLAATQKNIKSQKDMLKLTQVRFKNGLATGLDMAQAETVLASSESEVPPLKIELGQSYNNLALLLGLAPGSVEKELETPKDIPMPPLTVAVGVPTDLLRQRPDIRRSERQLAAQTARIGVATADLYPTFSLIGTVGFAATDASKWFHGGSGFFSFGPTFAWNLFDGGRIRSRIKVQDAITEQLLLDYEQTVLSAMRETENAFIAYVEQIATVAALTRTVKASTRSLKLATSLYKEGLADFQRVLDAQRSLFDYDNQLAQGQGQTSANLVSLYKALGGGWQPLEADPEPDKAQEGQPAKK